jgi:hypothetical protein
MAGKWNVITPTATTNLVKNPSFEDNVTDDWTAVTGSIARDVSFQKFGVSSAKITASTTANIKDSGRSINTATAITATAWFYIPSSGAVSDAKIAIYNTAVKLAEASADMTITDRWQRTEINYTTVGTTTHHVHLLSSSASGIFYVDGIQLEEQASATTYIDGSLDGGTWTGADHNSTTTRAVTYPYGGTVTNFSDDLSYPIERHDGAGMPQIQLSTQPYANSDGSKFQALKYGERLLKLFGTSNDAITDLSQLHQKRQALIKALMSIQQLGEEVPYKILRYTGADIAKECNVYLDNGLGLNMGGGFHENNLPIQFVGTDPNFYEVGNTASTLDMNDTTTFNSLAVRDVDGWSTGGITSIAGNTQVWSIAEGAGDGKVYIAGDYLNLNGTGANDYFTVYDKVAGTYSILGTTAPDAKVWKVAINSRGHVYIAGEFTSVDGVANTDGVAAWNGSAWVSITGAGTTGDIYDMLFLENGDLLAVGTITSIGGVSVDRVAQYNGSTWSKIDAVNGDVKNGVVYGVAQAPNGDIYVSGSFTNVAGSATYEGVAKWNGSAWSNMNGGLDTATNTKIVRDIQVTKDGTVYAGGDNVAANGTSTTIGYVARWNGSVWDDMNGGVNGVVRRMLPLANGELLVAGDFTAKAAGTQHNLSGLAIYNGTDFVPLDTDSLTNPRGLAEIDGALWIGHGGTSSVEHAGQTTISYAGSAKAYPTIKITRTGGTSLELRSIINETTGAVLYFRSYLMLDGETLTLSLNPEKFELSSSLFGNIPRALLAVSDTSAFWLTSGNGSGNYDNVLSAFAIRTGAPAITATVEWRTAYMSVD